AACHRLRVRAPLKVEWTPTLAASLANSAAALPPRGSNSRLGTALRRSCEPLVLRIADLTLSRGTKKLLDGVNLTLPVGHKAGLIGANGCGKSTLFAAIRGEIAPDAGAIVLPPKWKLAHV